MEKKRTNLHMGDAYKHFGCERLQPYGYIIFLSFQLTRCLNFKKRQSDPDGGGVLNFDWLTWLKNDKTVTVTINVSVIKIC